MPFKRKDKEDNTFKPTIHFDLRGGLSNHFNEKALKPFRTLTHRFLNPFKKKPKNTNGGFTVEFNIKSDYWLATLGLTSANGKPYIQQYLEKIPPKILYLIGQKNHRILFDVNSDPSDKDMRTLGSFIPFYRTYRFSTNYVKSIGYYTSNKEDFSYTFFHETGHAFDYALGELTAHTKTYFSNRHLFKKAFMKDIYALRGRLKEIKRKYKNKLDNPFIPLTKIPYTLIKKEQEASNSTTGKNESFLTSKEFRFLYALYNRQETFAELCAERWTGIPVTKESDFFEIIPTEQDIAGHLFLSDLMPNCAKLIDDLCDSLELDDKHHPIHTALRFKKNMENKESGALMVKEMNYDPETIDVKQHIFSRDLEPL